MQWIFDEATDLEREMVSRLLPHAEGGIAIPGYNVDIDVTNTDPHGTHFYTDSGAPFDTTHEHPARMVNIDWDGWEIKFALLDADYEPTGEFITLDSSIVTIRVG